MLLEAPLPLQPQPSVPRLGTKGAGGWGAGRGQGWVMKRGRNGCKSLTGAVEVSVGVVN